MASYWLKTIGVAPERTRQKPPKRLLTLPADWRSTVMGITKSLEFLRSMSTQRDK